MYKVGLDTMNNQLLSLMLLLLLVLILSFQRYSLLIKRGIYEKKKSDTSHYSRCKLLKDG